MSRLQDIYDTLIDEFDKLGKNAPEMVLATGKAGFRFNALPEEKKNEISKNLPFLYNELQSAAKKGEEISLDSDIASLVNQILDYQRQILKKNLISYKTHLQETQVQDTDAPTYSIWKEKFNLIETALVTLKKKKSEPHESKIREMINTSGKLHNARTQYIEDHKTKEPKPPEFKKTVDEKDAEIKLLEAQIHLLDNRFEERLSCIKNTTNLFIDKPFSDNPKTGLEILEQNKDGQFAQFIIDFVNFFRTIGLNDPEKIEAIKKDTSWQFWKKPRHTLISTVHEIQDESQEEGNEKNNIPKS